jgi:hypothetical protein
LLAATRSVARGRLLCYEKPVNWHEVIDARSLEMHRVVARELRADPQERSPYRSGPDALRAC